MVRVLNPANVSGAGHEAPTVDSGAPKVDDIGDVKVRLGDEKGEGEMSDSGAMSAKIRTSKSRADLACTLVVHAYVRADCVDQYEDWLSRMPRIASRHRGFLGSSVVRPTSSSDPYTVLLKFRDAAALEAWDKSEDRENMIAEIDHVYVKVKKETEMGIISYADYGTVSAKPFRPPPKYKVVPIITLYVYVLVTTFTVSGFPKAMGSAGVPLPITLIMILMCVVFTIVYVLLPLAFKFLRRWLMAPRPHFTCEPLRTLDEGFCCFAPNASIVALRQALEEERAKNRRLRRSAEGRLKRLETFVAISATDPTTPAPRMGEMEAKRTTKVVLKSLGADPTGATTPSSPRPRSASLVEHDPSENVTVVLRHSVREGMEDLYEAWTDKISKFAHNNYAGHLGTVIVRPPKDASAEDEGIYTTSFTFSNLHSLDIWLKSEDRARMVDEVQWLIEDTKVTAFQGFSPLDALFQRHMNNRMVPEPMWKKWAMTVFGLFFVVYPVLVFVGIPLGERGWSPFASVLVTSVINVPVFGYIIAPALGMCLHRWLATPYNPKNVVTRFFVYGFKCFRK